MIRRQHIIAAAVAFLVAVAAVSYVATSLQSSAARHSDTQRTAQARQDAKAREAAVYREQVRRWSESKRECRRGVTDRKYALRQAKAARRSNLIAGHMRGAPHRFRLAHLLEASADGRLVHRLRLRVPPTFTCDRAYPKPSP